MADQWTPGLFRPDMPAVGVWELASSWPPGRRSRTRMSSLELDGVQLVAVRVADTAHLARRGLPTCGCSRTYPAYVHTTECAQSARYRT